MKRQKRIPLYRQLHEAFTHNIAQGIWKPHDQIPTEIELAKKYQVSRITIRKAMESLIEEGLIYRIQGKGSFLSAAHPIDSFPISIPVSDSIEADVSRTVAFLIPSMEDRYAAGLLSGIQEVMARSGYQLLFNMTGLTVQQEQESIQNMVKLGVKGIIIFPNSSQTYSEDILKLTLSNYPIIVIDRYLRGIETNCVCSDHQDGGYMAVRHLLENGHRSIAIATGPTGTSSVEDRLKGYEMALSEHGIPVDHRLIWTLDDPGSVTAHVREHGNVTALVVAEHYLGVPVMRAMMEVGMNIPEDLSVVLFDDYEGGELFRVPPTVIEQSGKQLGSAAADRMLSLLDNPGQERENNDPRHSYRARERAELP